MATIKVMQNGPYLAQGNDSDTVCPPDCGEAIAPRPRPSRNRPPGGIATPAQELGGCHAGMLYM